MSKHRQGAPNHETSGENKTLEKMKPVSEKYSAKNRGHCNIGTQMHAIKNTTRFSQTALWKGLPMCDHILQRHERNLNELWGIYLEVFIVPFVCVFPLST